MRIIDKYILKELLGPFIFGVCAFSSIFIASGVLFRLVNIITSFSPPYTTVAQLFFLSLPEIVNYTFPMSMLLAALLSFGRLSASSEITAIKCGGLSFYRMVAPVFAVAFLISIFSMVFAEKVVPVAKLAYSRILYYDVQKNTKPRSQEHIVLKDVSGSDMERLTYARRFDEQEGVMYGVTVEEFKDNTLLHVQNAERAVWRDGSWVLYNGVIYDLSGGDGVSRSAQFQEQLLPVKMPPDRVGREQKRTDEMSVKELREHIRTLEHQYVSAARHKLEMYQRFSIPLASVVFALVGTPLGLQPHRSSSSIGLGLSIIIIFVYYAVMTFTMALGRGDVMNPLLAAFAPDLLGLVTGFCLIKKVSK